jgi:hypothetical protein
MVLGLADCGDEATFLPALFAFGSRWILLAGAVFTTCRPLHLEVGGFY